ncbi:FtsX-like permease family protein [Lysobacter firmicutimachus]|uniref:FtsX-like permease family protein n=1 Tax=Lysobacter firmicutimachus TaxID=1792846 RepID=A0AAU8MY97_9GAMM
MDIRPILSTLRRHKTAAALIVLEIALACAIVCNAVYLISQRLERMDRPTGVAEERLLRIQTVSPGKNRNDSARVQEDVQTLRGVPGVISAASASQIPLGGSSSNSGVRMSPDQKDNSFNASVYLGSEDLVETMGLRLIAGRDFLPGEYQNMETIEASFDEGRVAVAVVNRRFAERLFPGATPATALGKQFYSWGNAPITVIGVVEELLRPNDYGNGQYSMIFPVRPHWSWSNYLIATEPGRRAEVLKAAVAELQRVRPGRVVLKENTFAEIREEYYRQDRAMAWLLSGVILALLIVTALGIVGLASFWVQQRTKQIGVRRALGATRGQILRYFQTENFLLTTIGIALGMALAFAINLGLMKLYELPRLPGWYLPVGALCLWLLGQLAVYGPARRAAMVPPALATRSA